MNKSLLNEKWIKAEIKKKLRTPQNRMQMNINTPQVMGYNEGGSEKQVHRVSAYMKATVEI